MLTKGGGKNTNSKKQTNKKQEQSRWRPPHTHAHTTTLCYVSVVSVKHNHKEATPFFMCEGASGGGGRGREGGEGVRSVGVCRRGTHTRTRPRETLPFEVSATITALLLQALRQHTVGVASPPFRSLLSPLPLLFSVFSKVRARSILSTLLARFATLLPSPRFASKLYFEAAQNKEY